MTHKHYILAGIFVAIGATGSARADDSLARASHKLAETGNLTIGYLGGSITAGAGASDSSKTSWRALTTRWFRERFPKATIREVDAGLGGTGSGFGVYRVQSDLLDKHPDLVFVEFAVNDSGSQATSAADPLTPGMEGIVRHVWRANPCADIVFVYTTMKKLDEYHRRGELIPSVLRHQRVANYYGIISVNAGEKLWRQMMEEAKSWDDFLKDGVHPNDAGYAVYAGAVREMLEAQDWSQTSSSPKTLPAPLSPVSPENTRLIDAANYGLDGWTVEEQPLGRLWPRQLVCNTPGKEIAFDFEGNTIGVLWLAGENTGAVEWSVDGAPFQIRSSRSQYGGTKGRAELAMFANPLGNTALAQGPHQLRLRLSAEKEAPANGSRVSIAAFVINPPEKSPSSHE